MFQHFLRDTCGNYLMITALVMPVLFGADPTKGRKLFWNAKSSNLKEVFKEIADELSNMRLIN